MTRRRGGGGDKTSVVVSGGPISQHTQPGPSERSIAESVAAIRKLSPAMAVAIATYLREVLDALEKHQRK